MASLTKLLSSSTVDMPAVQALLDSLSPASRMAEAIGLGPAEQARLFDAADGFQPIGLDDMVPEQVGPLEEVVHEGRNTLPVFRRFAKVMCRPDNGGASGQLWGYNRNPRPIEVSVGPGYFVARPYGDGEVLVDYLTVPTGKPGHWPTILPNSARLSRFVYYGTQDILRGVSRHVSIGRAMRDGNVMNNWFVLCRMLD